MSFFYLEPPCSLQREGYPWSHRVQVALPLSYRVTQRAYPVLWVTDGNLEAAVSVLGLYSEPQIILVGVGQEDVSTSEVDTRRTYDFVATEDIYFEGSQTDFRRAFSALYAQPPRGGGADEFLSFLIEDVRPEIASRYRMDPEDHGILGVSLGGAFVARALFERPTGFARYICGSPTLNAGDHGTFWSEDRYAARATDLSVSLALAAGEEELTEDILSGWGIVSSTARLVERLHTRSYPSLQLGARIFPGENHASLIHPLIRWGVQTVWGEEIFHNPYLGEHGD